MLADRQEGESPVQISERAFLLGGVEEVLGGECAGQGEWPSPEECAGRARRAILQCWGGVPNNGDLESLARGGINGP